MTHASEAITQPVVHEQDSVVSGAWLGPAIGSGLLTIAWAVYLVPVLIGIFAAG